MIGLPFNDLHCLGSVTEDSCHVTFGHRAPTFGRRMPDPSSDSSQRAGGRSRQQAEKPRAGAEGEIARKFAHSKER